MKKFMQTCYKCGDNVKKSRCIKEGISLECLKCTKCGREFFTSSDLVKFDIIKGRRKMFRKFGMLGGSTMVRLLPRLIKDCKINPGDYGVFEKKPEGILIKLMHEKDLN